ncbi:hypothetical protein [Haloarcula sp. JP-L23]|uniref:hypothetical protein n=1 Tax=Haloarcula sp. JP-L23 TaxID=2716717 RepID=UPI00140ECE85|nr:hypothetical protein G9465_12215 [Haloarcula sp. JP-L23]
MSGRCRICGDSDKETREASPGEIGQGLLCTPVSLCEFCEQLVDAPHQDGCLVCGDDDTHFSFEIEGVSGADSLDTYYGGSLCTECSHDLLLEVQTRAMDSQASEDIDKEEVVSA